MASNRLKIRPSLETLDGRLLLSTGAGGSGAGGGLPPATVSSILPAPVNPTLAALDGFANAYLSYAGETRYNPVYDLNHNNQVGQADGKILLHELAPLSPDIPLKLTVTIAPQDKLKTDVPTNLGGVTALKSIIVQGRTTPGALIFTGSGTLDLKLRTAVGVADGNGFFAFKLNLPAGINQFDLLAVDAYGHQLLRAFPIYWTGYGAYEAKHPVND